jgi:PAS domain S-box-containing protein
MTEDESKRRSDDDQQSKAELLHNLQVHQIELEMQNRQLREAQQELEEARDRYADLYDFAPVGYLTLDESGTVLEINLTGAAMLGFERLNIVGKPFINRLVTSSVPLFSSHLRQTFSNPGNSVTELQIKTKEGKSRIVNLESLVIHSSRPTCRIMMTDITEQRRIAVSLQLSRSAQDALLNAIPALVFYQDAELRYLNVSQAFADFVGRPPEDIRGKTVYDIFPPHVAEDLHNISSSVLKTGMAIYGFENSLPDANGGVYDMSTVLAAFRDLYGNPIGLVGISNDISTYKSTANSNNELLLQNRKLTRNLYAAQEEERRRIAVELHDELGQWFTAIQAEAQAIDNITKDNPKIHQSALAISKSASAVHEVIRGMLRHLRPVLLDELGLEDSLRELQRQWCNAHPEVVCEFKPGFSLDGLGEELNLTIYRLIQEALNNVTSHAHASRVTITMEQDLDKDSGLNCLVLRVEDDGAGFDSRQVRAGIGLVGMRERIIAVGGEFLIESNPGLGTKIMARLPLVGTKRKS